MKGERPSRKLAAALLVALVQLGAVTGLAPGCRGGAGDLERDGSAIARIVNADAQVDMALYEADRQASAGHDAEAADLVHDALPLADRALDAARSAPVTTAWGTEQRDVWVALLTARRKEMSRYEAALRGGDLEEALAATEAQMDLQRRALAASQAARPPLR